MIENTTSKSNWPRPKHLWLTNQSDLPKIGHNVLAAPNSNSVWMQMILNSAPKGSPIFSKITTQTGKVNTWQLTPTCSQIVNFTSSRIQPRRFRERDCRPESGHWPKSQNLSSTFDSINKWITRYPKNDWQTQSPTFPPPPNSFPEVTTAPESTWRWYRRGPQHGSGNYSSCRCEDLSKQAANPPPPCPTLTSQLATTPTFQTSLHAPIVKAQEEQSNCPACLPCTPRPPLSSSSLLLHSIFTDRRSNTFLQEPSMHYQFLW